MNFADKMKSIAIEKSKRLVLPEGTELRTIEAASLILKEKIAKEVFLVGDKEEISNIASKNNLDISGVSIVNPLESEKIDEYANEYYELRKAKGLSLEEAKEQILEPLKWGCMMVRLSDADAMVAGAKNSTGKVLISSFQIIKTAPNVKKASSCFVMSLDNKKWGVDGNLIFADCATIPNPDAETLAEIAIASAKSCKTFLNKEAKVALLSFSTKGSAKHENVEKVQEAFTLVKAKAPELQIEGELQADAALIDTVAAKKAPGSNVAGKANVLVFPDLQSGNIGYKLVERLAGANAYGPILQGFAKPVSDLSRGCSVDDIVVTSAITLAQVED